jgi:hypothetical protein
MPKQGEVNPCEICQSVLSVYEFNMLSGALKAPA